MSRLQIFETKYEICKDLTFNAIISLLGEYEDEKYYGAKIDQTFDFSLVSTLDLLVLPLLDEHEHFTLNTFLKSHLNKEEESQFKNGLSRINRFEDLIELVILLKSRIGSTHDYDHHQVNIHLYVTYFLQMKKLGELHFACRSLMSDLYKHTLENMAKIKNNELVERLKEMEHTANIVCNKVAQLEAKTKSKEGLICCMDLIFGQQNQYYSL